MRPIIEKTQAGPWLTVAIDAGWSLMKAFDMVEVLHVNAMSVAVAETNLVSETALL